MTAGSREKGLRSGLVPEGGKSWAHRDGEERSFWRGAQPGGQVLEAMRWVVQWGSEVAQRGQKMENLCGGGAGAEAAGRRKRQQSPAHPGPSFLQSPPCPADPKVKPPALLSVRGSVQGCEERSKLPANAAGEQPLGCGVSCWRVGAVRGRAEPQDGRGGTVPLTSFLIWHIPSFWPQFPHL